MKLNSVHVRSLAINASNISTETIDGDEHIVIRGVVPVVDDVVMNGGLYPVEEINKSFKTLEGKQMPLGHPKIGGEYVSADTPRAVNQYHVGAWQENVRKDGERVVMDMKINRRYAEATEKGGRLIERLDAMMAGNDAEPIHVSTGLLLQREMNSGKSKGKKYTWIARNMQFDHTAILLDEPGAATPGEGVGIFVNSAGDKIDIEQVNLSDASDCTKEGLVNKTKFFFSNASKFSFDDIQRAISRKLQESAGEDEYLWPDTVWPDSFVYSRKDKYLKQKYLIDDDGMAEFVGEPVEVVRKPTEYEIKTNGDSNPMKDMIINALKAAGKPTDGLTDEQLLTAYNEQLAEEKKPKDKPEDNPKDKGQAQNSEEAPSWFKPFADKLANIETGLTANADKEKSAKRDAVKAKFGLDETAVNALDGAALDGLYAQCATSHGLSGAFNHSADNKSFSEMPE